MARKNVKKTSAQAPRSPVVVVLIIAAVVAIGAVGYAVSSNVGSNNMAMGPIDVPGLNNTDSLRALATPISKGNEAAQIKIIEFGDYQCPSCRYFHDSIKPRLELAYVDTGIAQFVFYDFPLSQIHPFAFIAARAARCAGDQGNEQYWQFHTKLYENQPTWSTRAQPPARDFVAYAEELGMDESAFESCLRSEKHADVVTANQKAAQNLNLPGTPAVLIQVGNGIPRQVEWTSLETLYPAIVAAMDSVQAGN